jgi:hypothetical protein
MEKKCFFIFAILLPFFVFAQTDTTEANLKLKIDGAQTFQSNNKIDKIQFKPGGYSDKFANTKRDIIINNSIFSSKKYNFSIDVKTDNFAQPGEKYLGGYSYGYSEYSITACGPLLPNYKKVRFFIDAKNFFQRSPAGFFKGIDLKGIYEPSLGANADTFDVYYPDGYLVNLYKNTYKVHGNLSYDLNPINLRLKVGYTYTQGRNGVGIQDYRTKDRAGLNVGETFTTSLKLSHKINPISFYDISVNYLSSFSVNMDPIFKHNITVYGDSIENAAVGTQMKADGTYMDQNLACTFSFRPGPIPYNAYEKQNYKSFGGKFNLVYQLGKHHKLKTGGEASYLITRYYFIEPRAIAGNVKAVCDGNPYDIYAKVNNYGYDVYGNQTESDLEAPKKPFLASAYLQNNMEYFNLIINADLRLDYIDPDEREFVGPFNIQFDENGRIDPACLKDIDPYLYISPRLGISYPFTEKIILYAQYSKFVQQKYLRDIYQGYSTLADNIKGGFATQSPACAGFEPGKTTLYEIGFKQQIGEYFAFDITGFYKNIKDQVQIHSIYTEMDANHNQYYAWVNEDLATIKGVEIKLDLRRTHRASASFDYTFSSALEKGPSSGFRAIYQSPNEVPYFSEQIAPLIFDQAHRGFFNMDYRFFKDDGPTLFGYRIFSQTGANILFSFSSGSKYTKIDYGANSLPIFKTLTMPWIFQLDTKVDKSFKIGPVNVNAYIWVINLLNRENIIDVFNTTGDPYDDGYLASEAGKAQINVYKQYGEEFAQIYQDLYKALIYDPAHFGPPRQIRLGLRLDL